MLRSLLTSSSAAAATATATASSSSSSASASSSSRPNATAAAPIMHSYSYSMSSIAALTSSSSSTSARLSTSLSSSSSSSTSGTAARMRRVAQQLTSSTSRPSSSSSASSSSASAAAAQPPPRRSSDVARLIEVFGNTRRRKHMKDPRSGGIQPVTAWPKELLHALSIQLRERVENLFSTFPPFNDPSASLDYSLHKYQHTREEWHMIIDIALSRLYTFDAARQVEERNLACWLSCAMRFGQDNFYPHVRVGRHLTRIGKYLRFLWASTEERQLIWDHVNDSRWHCSHLCHNTLCINPMHMVIESNAANASRTPTCLKAWRARDKIISVPGNAAVIDSDRPIAARLNAVAPVPVCPAQHQPKCLFMNPWTGFIVPEYNYRRSNRDRELDEDGTAADDAFMEPADEDDQSLSIQLVSDYHPVAEHESSAVSSLLANWASLREIDPPVNDSWERGMVATFKSAAFRVAAGNFRIRTGRSSAVSFSAASGSRPSAASAQQQPRYSLTSSSSTPPYASSSHSASSSGTRL